MRKPAIFLDRDGVIIENRSNYVLSWSDVEIFDQAIETLAQFAHLDYLFVIVTNQSPVGRGLISYADANEINSKLISIIHERGGRIDAAYICPHAPSENCDCRKPRPGMLKQAAEDLSIDLSESIMIGDALTDLKAGIQAGVKDVILLETGRGQDQVKLPEMKEITVAKRYKDLTMAFRHYFAIV